MKAISLPARIKSAADVCRRRGITQARIADALGASQSQVSRILGGRSRSASRLAEEVCLYVERLAGGGVTAEAVLANGDLIEAVQSVWDGSSSHAKALSLVIRSLAVLREPGGSSDLSGGTRQC